jgi:putative chitinase
MITADLLAAVMPTGAKAHAIAFIGPLDDACHEFGIDQPLRIAAFLAQAAHESGELTLLRELWGPTPEQTRYEPPATKATELGNIEPGDGKRFRGRGIFQVTGRGNYERCSIALYGNPLSLQTHPELLEEPVAACRSAGWFWISHDLSTLADARQFDLITRRINGGDNGAEQRRFYYARALRALSIQEQP